MTEAEWQHTGDVHALVKYLSGKRGSTARRFRLFGVASGRRFATKLPNAACHAVVEAAEQFADGMIGLAELSAARRAALQTQQLIEAQDFVGVAWARVAAGLATEIASLPGLEGTGDLLRDIFGNPFRPVSVEPSWLTSTVVALAEGIYQERAFDRLPILADALMDAGCDNADVLGHCRGDGPHVRGCWVVDMLTGRT
jgi:hypothetical protein